jgi:hypothetical protein
LPDGLARAIREGRTFEASHGGIRFAVTAVEVDSHACSRVKPDDIGTVLGKVDVAIERPE